jgi:spermidine synthase
MPGRTVRQWELGVLAFVIGAGVMAVEMTASRLIAPYFGASLFVWTSLIVTVLAAMSVGYWVGGSLASRGKGLDAVGALLCGAALLLLFGVAVIPTFSSTVSGLVVLFSNASVALFVGSLVISLFIFAWPVFMLAASGPIVLKAWTAHGDVGAASGRYFAVSTVGSVLGTVAPSLALVPAFGARLTIAAVAAAFLIAGVRLLPARFKAAAAFIVAPGILYSGLVPATAPADVRYERESPYQLIRVVESGGLRFLVFNEGTGIQSAYDPDGTWTGFYTDAMALLPHLRDPGPEGHDAAILGLAGGSIARAYRAAGPEGEAARIVGVEVDADVIDVAREHFDLDATGVETVNMDGRAYLATTERRFDVIVADAYSTQLYIPPHLATREFFAVARAALKTGGVLTLNVNAPSSDSRLLVALVNSVAAEFPSVAVMPIPGSWNHLIFASDRPVDLSAAASRLPDELSWVASAASFAYGAPFDERGETFTDDRAPVEFLTDAMIIGQAFGRDL